MGDSFCPWCGSKVKDDHSFCRSCGKPLSSGPSASTGAPTDGPAVPTPPVPAKVTSPQAAGGRAYPQSVAPPSTSRPVSRVGATVPPAVAPYTRSLSRSPPDRRRPWIIAGVVAAVLVLVLVWGASDGWWPASSPPASDEGGGNSNAGGATQVYSYSTTVYPQWSPPQGGFTWGWGGAIQRENPTSTTVSWSAGIPAAICLVFTGQVSRSYSYAGCQAAGGSSSSGDDLRGSWSISIPANADYNLSTYAVWISVAEPTLAGGQTASVAIQVWTNSSSSFLLGEGPGDVSIGSYTDVQQWQSGSVALPSSGTHYAAYLNFSSAVPVSTTVETEPSGDCQYSASEAMVCLGEYSGAQGMEITLDCNSTTPLSFTAQAIAWG